MLGPAAQQNKLCFAMQTQAARKGTAEHNRGGRPMHMRWSRLYMCTLRGAALLSGF